MTIISNTNLNKEAKRPLVQVVCLDRHKNVYQQAVDVFRAEPGFKVIFEKSMERVLDLVENDVCDVLLATSAMVREGHSNWREFIEVLNAKSPWTQVIFLINPREIALASRALKAGSYHYAKLPISNEEIRLLVEAALASRPNVGRNLQAVWTKRRSKFEDMVGTAPAMKNVYRMIRQAAATNIPVLVTGETGTGKDLAARAIHQLSDPLGPGFSACPFGRLASGISAYRAFRACQGSFHRGGQDARRFF